MTLERKAPMPRLQPRDPQTALKRGTGLARAPRPPKSHKNTGASQAVRDMVWARDRGQCARCGKGLAKGQGAYSIHRRVLRSHGVADSPQAHVLLCGSGSTGCLGHVRAHPAEARAAGWMLLGNARTDPGAEPVMIALPSGYGWFLLTPDGERRAAPPPGP